MTLLDNQARPAGKQLVVNLMGCALLASDALPVAAGCKCPAAAQVHNHNDRAVLLAIVAIDC
eukprot:CAMPEP_0202874228 /NCGR_PEP_ID=MMETSP1391-20130828/25016_1 /ASSEMBLY_ACC=CAM_ASM_000867 /TAXON_ID=1034604 /ORGANISM="Chlamydomonas leiostraca, Strain SAG 11-49" /LENGTH=61 /DNA_ID=CAMNT_0049555625 /DNA_START=143 /DNA_END=329 /DNA_ORIENTATION=+